MLKVGAISQERLKIGVKLLLSANRKSYVHELSLLARVVFLVSCFSRTGVLPPRRQPPGYLSSIRLGHWIDFTHSITIFPILILNV